MYILFQHSFHIWLQEDYRIYYHIILAKYLVAQLIVAACQFQYVANVCHEYIVVIQKQNTTVILSFIQCYHPLPNFTWLEHELPL